MGMGYWFGIEGFTAWELPGHHVTYPVLGWIYMIVVGLIAVIGIRTSFHKTFWE